MDQGAEFAADRQGRWPTVVAAECQVSAEMCAFIVDAESRWIAGAEERLLNASDRGDLDCVKAALKSGADVNAVQKITGLTAFHYAVGRDHLEIATYLAANGANCLPHRSGRWPSTIAEHCAVSGAMRDFVVDEERRWGVLPPRP